MFKSWRLEEDMTSGTIGGVPDRSDAFPGGARPGRAFCFFRFFCGSVLGTEVPRSWLAERTEH